MRVGAARRRMMRVLAWILALAGVHRAQGQQAAGRYVNPNYRFAVRIPAGLRIRTARAPAPNHGFDARIAPGAAAWATAAYEALDASTLSAEVDSMIAVRWKDGCRLAQRKATALGGAPAAELTVRCAPRTRGGPATVEHGFVAMRSPPGRGPVVYEVGVKYPAGAAAAAEAERVLRSLAAGFSFTSAR